MVSLSQFEENMENKFKKKHQGAAFMAPVESILLYGKDIDMKAIEKKLDGCLPICSYIHNLKSDTSLESAEELRTAVLDRETWKRRAESRRALARP